MKVVTAEQMRYIDQHTIEKYGISGLVLMERAGLAVAEKVRDLFGHRKVVVLAGSGNNGGDGIAAARNLHNWGWKVKVLQMFKEDRLSHDCLVQYRIAKKMGVYIEFRKTLNKKDIHASVVIDALLGTGLNKPVESPLSDVISLLNSSDVQVVSVDMPSGISSDTGNILGDAVYADHTVTFGLPKAGHFLYPGAEYSGHLHIENIGFPDELLKSDSLKMETIDRTSIVIPERDKFSHKGDYGHVLIIAGSRGKTGAALMAARACLRAGAGLVTIGVPETLADVMQSRITEEMVLPLPDNGHGILSEKAYEPIMKFLGSSADILAIGPGISVNDGIRSLLKKIITACTSPMILDADAINAFEGNAAVFKKSRAPIILTPHAGEMARLLGSLDAKKGAAEIDADRINCARSFSRRTGVYLILKGAPTIISDCDGGVYINTTGNPGMATAGAGDVLTGMLAGLMGQSMHPLDACRTGVFLHGLAGDMAAKSKGMQSMIASDIISMVSNAFLSVS